MPATLLPSFPGINDAWVQYHASLSANGRQFMAVEYDDGGGLKTKIFEYIKASNSWVYINVTAVVPLSVWTPTLFYEGGTYFIIAGTYHARSPDLVTWTSWTPPTSVTVFALSYNAATGQWMAAGAKSGTVNGTDPAYVW